MSLTAPRQAMRTRPRADVAVEAAPADHPWHAYAVVIAAICVMVGVYWDISWHMSIGRDTFWTPAHLLIQAGGLIAGTTSGYVALKTTFRPSSADRSTSVRLWGFHAPLGAWVCIWGCFAMIASAPFDNWWHDAYGLDVKIVSPPHTVLALGIYAIVNGAMLLTLARQNRDVAGEQRVFRRLYLVAGGMFLMNFAIFLTEYSIRFMQHGALFYIMNTVFFPFALVAVARASKVRFAATIASAVYMGAMLLMMWIIQLFPAQPMLGPIYNPITRMVGLAWPLWLVVPALGIDLLLERLPTRTPSPVRAISLGVVFAALFIAVQWPWASFMVESPLSRNWFFNADNFVYWATPAYMERSHRFISDGSAFLPSAVKVVAIASLSAWAGLGWGHWMSRVRR